MKHVHEQDEVTVRVIPVSRWPAIGWLVLVLVVAATAAWEWRMRSIGLRAGDLDDGRSHWTVERRRIDARDHDDVVIFGSSRILFDTDLDVWEEMTGRRPIQLALPGTSPRAFFAHFLEQSDFSGLVVVDVTPEGFFSERVSALPQYLDLNETWDEESPSTRFGHQVGILLSKVLAFLDDSHKLGKLIERLEIPDRAGVRRPYLEVWKLTESTAGRQVRLWPRFESDSRLREHAVKVWMSRSPPPLDETFIAKAIDSVRRDVEEMRARGGQVVFIRPPSDGPYYEREQQNAPRGRTWDRLLQETGAFGIHFEDYPAMQGLEIPEHSHLSRESATRFTRAYVEVLAREVPMLRSRPPES